jgi:hypothetical protein
MSTCTGRGIAPWRLAGQQFEGERLQRVAGEDGGRLVERDVAGRLAAAQIVVVHRRQVVVDQRVGVDHLDGGGAGRPRCSRAHPAGQRRAP